MPRVPCRHLEHGEGLPMRDLPLRKMELRVFAKLHELSSGDIRSERCDDAMRGLSCWTLEHPRLHRVLRVPARHLEYGGGLRLHGLSGGDFQ
mmetsp:Transcript_28993/g.62994  ORF Transcript_28993/g.62994 Transcript_28993/m.62994 type:complete len:92 (-) Transcript_28993:1-276(-)